MAVCISLATLNKSQQGQLLFESRYNTAKQLHSQLHYIWLNDNPVGFVVKDNISNNSSDNNVNNNGDWKIYAIHTDHLNTPGLVTNQNGSEVWRWASDAFGESAAAGSIEFNLRFPGQHYDGESGLHYNYFRDYNAQTGRYVQSDPIGLRGGLNTYGYAYQNPIMNYDPDGQFVFLGVPVWVWAVSGTVASGGFIYHESSKIYDQALSDARTSGLPGGHNGSQDAYRHCLATCESSRKLGENITQCTAWANEKKGDWRRGQEQGERAMDDHNNSIGIEFGNSSSSYSSCKSQCLSAVNSGVTINNYRPGSTPNYSPGSAY